MIAHAPCAHENRKKHGRTPSGEQRYRCRDCGKTFVEKTQQLAGMRIGLDRAAQIVAMLVEGISVSAASRLLDVDKHTIIDLLLVVGSQCKDFMEKEIAGIVVEDVQVDEIWQFIYCKRKTAARLGLGNDVGDSYCFTAVERNTKLMIAWHLGHRTQEDTDTFCEKLRDATAGHYQLSTDGYQTYRTAVPMQLGGKVDYGMVVKIFGHHTEDDQRQYSPATITGMRKEVVWGQPDEDKICTSHTERMNGTIRNFTKRMGRLTYCFSKKWECHEAALALCFAAYNWCKRHRSLKGQTPAMATGLANHVWTIRELLEKISSNK